MHSGRISQYTDDLFRYAMALVRDTAQAEDLVQETFVRALRAFESLRPESNLKAWLFAILRNTWLNQLRHLRTLPETVEIDEDHHVASARSFRDPHTEYVAQWTVDVVREAVENLPLEFREVIVLREFEDLSYQEIAELLNCPQGTVMSRLARARARLRSLLASTQASGGRKKSRLKPFTRAAAST